MIPAFSPFLAVRYLLARRINLLGIGGVMFAVWAMIVVNAVFTGFVSEIRTDVRRSAPDLLVTDLPHDTSYDRLRAAIEVDPVVASAPRLRHHGLCQPLRVPRGIGNTVEASEVDFDHQRGGFALLLGIDPIREPAVSDLPAWLSRSEDAIRRHFGATRPASKVLDEPSAKRRARLLLPDEVEWRARGRADLPRAPTAARHVSSLPGLLLGWRRVYHLPWLSEGDPVDVLTAAFVPDPSAQGGARMRTHRVHTAFAGWFSTGHRMFDETEALLPIETLRTMLGHDLADPSAIDLVTDVAVRVRAGTTPAELAACKRRIADAVQALLPAGSPSCSVLDWEEQNPVFLSAVGREQTMMQFVLFVVMLVSVFVIYATLHMMVVQKWKDIGILAALGGTQRGIGFVFLLCGLVIAATGALLGAALGAFSVRHLNDFNDWLFAHTSLELFPRALFDLQRVPVRLETSWLLQVALGSIGLALVVAFLPSRKASRMNPVKALSYE